MERPRYKNYSPKEQITKLGDDCMKYLDELGPELIKYLDSVIVTDDDGCQWLTVEFNDIEDKIKELLY
jgi:hypothetical protein